MTPALLKALEELLDAADFALGPLDDFSGYDAHPYDLQREPNEALAAHRLLKAAIKDVEALMKAENQ